MKKTALFVLFTAATAAYAASTCETRVDSHQEATTRQRVAYCLTEEPQAAPEAGPELVYSGSYVKEPAEEKPVKSTVKDGYFKEDKVSIRRQYVGSERFPAFVNDTKSEQERAALEQAYLKELAEQQEPADPAAVKKATTQRPPARLDEQAAENPVEDEQKEVSATVLTAAEQARGLRARQHKPNRYLKEQSISAEPVLVNAPAAQPVAEEKTAVETEVNAVDDPLLSPNYNDDDLNDELGLNDDTLETPISAPVAGNK